jgi:flagellum-specific ATP synthase
VRHAHAERGHFGEREWLAAICDSEDLVSVGAYVQGSNTRIDQARSKLDAIERFLCQEADSVCRFSDAVESLTTL